MQCPDSDFASCYDLRRFGATGDGVTVDTAALQQAIDCCHEAGGGTLFVPAGTYLTGTLYLKSHVTLHLSAGATLLGSPRREDYNADDIFPENPVFTVENVTGAHLIIAYQAEDVAITGEGTIDGNSSAFFEPLPPEEVTTTYRSKTRNFPIGEWRPGMMVYFCRCTKVSVRDVSLVNSPYWTLFLLGCEKVQIRGLRITNPPQTANGDGIDVDCCRDVTISDCIICSGDDSITLRGHSTLLGEHAQPCEQVTVSNCVLSTPCNAVRVGVGDGIVRDCLLSNLIIKESRTGINLICAYSERSAHGTTIENLHFENVLMDTVNLVKLALGGPAKLPAAIHNVSFSHLRGLGREGMYFTGNPGLPLSGVRLKDVHLRLTGSAVDAEYAHKTPPVHGGGGVPAGLFVRHAEHLRVSGLEVEWEEVGGGWQHAVMIEDSEDVVIADLEATAPPTAPDNEVVHCTRVKGLRMRREQ